MIHSSNTCHRKLTCTTNEPNTNKSNTRLNSKTHPKNVTSSHRRENNQNTTNTESRLSVLALLRQLWPDYINIINIQICCSVLHTIISMIFTTFFHLVPVVPFPRFNGGLLLGPLPIVTSASLVSVPNPHLCASRL